MQNFSADDLHGTTVYDRDGQKVGRVQQVYLDDDSGRPSWVTVNTGFFGTNESLVPVEGAQVSDDILKVPFDKQIIKDAPHFDPGHHLDESDEGALYDYYGLGGDDGDTHASGEQDDRSRADRVMDRSGDERGVRDSDPHDRGGDLGDRDRVGRGDPDRRELGDRQDYGGRDDLQDRAVGQTGGHGGGGSAAAAGIGGLAAAAAGRDTRDDRRNELDDRTRSGRAGDAFTEDTDTRSGDADLGTPDADQPDDDHERDLLERERDLLKRERELLDKDRQLLERDRQRRGRPRLRRHERGQR